MRRAKLFRSVVLVGISSGMIALAGCESAADRQAANGGNVSTGTHAVGSVSSVDSPIGAAPASPNTNGIRGEQTVGERGNTGTISSGSGSPTIARPLNGQNGTSGIVVPTTQPTLTTLPSSISNGESVGPSAVTGAGH